MRRRSGLGTVAGMAASSVQLASEPRVQTGSDAQPPMRQSPERDDCGVVDWGAGDYEATAAELAPVAEAVVERARISAGEDVLDVACGTGNAALLAAARGARVVGVDA